MVIDIGINQIEEADGGSKVIGDRDYDSCSEVAGWITPVPGGVGPVTVARAYAKHGYRRPATKGALRSRIRKSPLALACPGYERLGRRP